jgi:multiple sugar transport system permease protein
MTRKKLQQNFKNVGSAILLGILLIFALFPLYWILLTSFKTNRDITNVQPVFIFQPTLEHWNYVLSSSEIQQDYRNSLIIAFSTLAFVLVVAVMAAYSLARSSYKHRDDVAYFILSQRMMPAIAVVLPIYVLFSQIHMLDRLETLIFINIAFNLPLSIWMIRGFIEALSIELEEAAVLDGTTWFGAFIRISLPQMVPGLLSTALLVFIYTINEFFFAVILSGTNARPITVAVQHFLPTGVRGTMFGEAAAASLLIMAPSVIFAMLMQKYLVSGISLGALKG